MVELKVYKIGQFAVMVNLTVRQLQELDRNGSLPAKRTVTGRRCLRTILNNIGTKLYRTKGLYPDSFGNV